MSGSVLTDAFFASLESSSLEVGAAETLPPACYTDATFYEFEKDAIFYREWLCVGREAWLKEPGDYFTTSHLEEPILVVRTRNRLLKAFSPVCRHRAALVAEGNGNARSFRCPYHHWTYSLDGRLLGAPAMDRTCDFAKDEIALPEFKLEVWLGFIFINFDPGAAPLAPRLAALTAALDHYDLPLADESGRPGEPRKEPWNWKVRFENSNDGYHANKLHAGPVHDCCPSECAIFPKLPADSAGYFRFNGTTHIDCSFNPTLRAVLPIFPGLTEQDRSRFLFFCIPPSLTIGARCDMVTYNIFHVQGVAAITSQRGWLVSPGAKADPLFEQRLAMNVAVSGEINAQDRHVNTLVQIGLRSRFASHGRYSWQEESQVVLKGWLVQRYRDGWARRRRVRQEAAE
jgi:phenylpropionate dioxygenase-like ring-hydroxylating dioxygenase large terminal subunit